MLTKNVQQNSQPLFQVYKDSQILDFNGHKTNKYLEYICDCLGSSTL